MYGQTPGEIILDPSLSPYYLPSIASSEVVPSMYSYGTIHYNGIFQNLVENIRENRERRRKRRKAKRDYRRGLITESIEHRQERLARRQERKLAKEGPPNGEYIYDDGGMMGEEDMYYEDYAPATDFESGYGPRPGPSPVMLAGGAALLLGGLWYMKNK